jgi:hypothetical protein
MASLAYAKCTPDGPTAADTALANRLRPKMNGHRLGRSINGDNICCARVIVTTTQKRGLHPRAAVIAMTTAIAESTLHNYTEAGDHDSLGLFQQRPSQGWGTPAQITNPVYATNKFLDAMLRKYPKNSWMNGDIGSICQRVQVSAFPDAYTPEVHDAQLIVDALASPLRKNAHVMFLLQKKGHEELYVSNGIERRYIKDWNKGARPLIEAMKRNGLDTKIVQVASDDELDDVGGKLVMSAGSF